MLSVFNPSHPRAAWCCLQSSLHFIKHIVCFNQLPIPLPLTFTTYFPFIAIPCLPTFYACLILLFLLSFPHLSKAASTFHSLSPLLLFLCFTAESLFPLFWSLFHLTSLRIPQHLSMCVPFISLQQSPPITTWSYAYKEYIIPQAWFSHRTLPLITHGFILVQSVSFLAKAYYLSRLKSSYADWMQVMSELLTTFTTKQ